MFRKSDAVNSTASKEEFLESYIPDNLFLKIQFSSSVSLNGIFI